MLNAGEIGVRIRRLRLACRLGQVEFADRVGIAQGAVSRLENGRYSISDELLESVARILDCTPAFLTAPSRIAPATRPWLRAYADASKRAVDRQMAECVTATEVIDKLGLRTLPDTVPVFDGDLADDMAIEDFAMDCRAVTGIGEAEVVNNAIRAAERLGCVVLPMGEELGRHLGLSTRSNLTPFICVSRPSLDPSKHVPGDRQRFSVLHELGHLALHSDIGPPETPDEAGRIEKQAHRFAAAFLAPGDALLDELTEHGGRVTLRTLALLKSRWGIAIKALVMRFRTLRVIDDAQARSLYKQISARGWSTNEPIPVGNEDALWLTKAINKHTRGDAEPLGAAAREVGIGRSYLERWTDWSPTAASDQAGDVVPLADRRDSRVRPRTTAAATVTPLPVRPTV